MAFILKSKNNVKMLVSGKEGDECLVLQRFHTAHEGCLHHGLRCTTFPVPFTAADVAVWKMGPKVIMLELLKSGIKVLS